jgi:hypothetical protein
VSEAVGHNGLSLVEPDPTLLPLVTHIATGRDADLEKQLVIKSRQPHIMSHTPNDAKNRFSSLDAFEKWLSNGREVYWLLGASSDLAGIIWYGKRTFPINMTLGEIPTETFAIRLYNGYVGRGLAVPFIKQSLRLSAQNKHTQGLAASGVWLETDIDNAAAQKTYLAIGFQEVDRNTDTGRVTFILPSANVEDIARHVIADKHTR